MSANYDFTVDRGTDFSATIVLYRDDGEGVPVPRNLATTSATFRVRDPEGSRVYVATGEVTVGPEAGTLHIALSAAVTSALPVPALYRFDLNVGGLVERPLEGLVL